MCRCRRQLAESCGPQPPAADTRSLLFAAFRRLRTADLWVWFIALPTFADGPKFFSGPFVLAMPNGLTTEIARETARNRDSGLIGHNWR